MVTEASNRSQKLGWWLKDYQAQHGQGADHELLMFSLQGVSSPSIYLSIHLLTVVQTTIIIASFVRGKGAGNKVRTPA